MPVASEPATADPVFDMLATIALLQGADPDEVACGYEEVPGSGGDYHLVIGRRSQRAGALLLEESVWPALHASAMAANANALSSGTDLADYARDYDDLANA